MIEVAINTKINNSYGETTNEDRRGYKLTNSLDIFDKCTASWFTRSLGMPTAVQEAAWPAIAAGGHTLVSAPTGTGKTLSAFLVFIDRLKTQAKSGTLKQELQLIYVSPLKSLAGDIRENLRRPLDGILQEERNGGALLRDSLSDLSIAIRTGDTPQNERRRMIKTPPHILITTPESLYLMLTSKSGQSILRTAKAIIIDELHAIIDSKRGAHLMLTIARLDRLCSEPLQRIGLSATSEPLSRAAEYLSPEPVNIVAPKMNKEVKLVVTSPLIHDGSFKKDTVWQELAKTVYAHCEGQRSVIAFVEGRRYAEKLAYYVNELGGEGFARTHHGSLSKEQRFEVENTLRNGNLRLLCATSSMELGIDVGEIDQVFQIGCPRSISSTMQRLGRAGHNPNRISVMHIFPRAAAEGLYCGLTAEVTRNGCVEHSSPPRLCLDVLAQHLVSMAAADSYHLEEVMEILPRAYPFCNVTQEDVRDVLCMLAGDYEHQRDIPVRPRILYDRIHDRVEGDSYSRMLAISAGGTIPDKGLYSVKTENGVKLGEVDEEFVFESRVGDKFLLGTFAWQIATIKKDTVVVTQSNISGARLPFWKGEIKGRRMQTGLAFGRILRRLGSAYDLLKELYKLGLDEPAAQDAEEFLKRQMIVTEVLPDDRTILIEHFRDDTGNHQMMVHSVFGRQVNEPLAILTQEAAKRHTNTNICCVDDDDGFLLFPYEGGELPEGLLQGISPESARPVLAALLPETPLFNMTFRYNAGRALMMGVRKTGRQPLWVQRMRSAEMLDSLVRYENHPLIRETKRECLEDYWDLQGVEFVLKEIQSGNIRVREMFLDVPSPMSLPLRQQTEAAMMYDYTPTPMGIHHAAEEALKQVQMIVPEPEQLARVSERIRLPEDEKQLHSLLMIEGDLIAGELDVPIDWLETLTSWEQAKYIEPGLWIAAEQEEQYTAALKDGDLEARMHLVRRALRYRGAQSLDQVGERYLWTEKTTLQVLTALCQQGSVVESGGLYYHAELYDRARQETVKSRRGQIKTLPPERYAALLGSRTRITAPPGEQLETALKLLCDQTFPAELWESVLLPARVGGYRPELLDTLLAQGNLFWHITPDSGLSFHLYEDIDWEADMSEVGLGLDDNEKIVYEALLKRGASFMQRLSGLLGGVSPHDSLLELAEKGLLCSDSFLPVRQLLNKEKLKKASARQRVNARVMALNTGRWELSRPLIQLSIQSQLQRAFDRAFIICRETAQGIPWEIALETLRVWEYTGRVRRGYFIQGLSGVQFIREKDFTGTILALEHPGDEIIWLSAVDSAQPWGKSLAHMQGRSFLNVLGTAVALRSGVPIAVFERQGKLLRVFEVTALSDTLRIFANDYCLRRIFPMLNRVTVKQYPQEAVEALISAGFTRELQDYVLYR
jgi:ATP-dependent helicase Lhr and Lhr-like helicase